MSTTFSVRGASSGWVFDLGNGVIPMETVLCTRCGLLYAMPEALVNAAYSKGHGEITWRCPNRSCNAENWGFHGKSEAEKARENAEEQATLDRRRAARLAADLDQTKASLRAQKAAKTRAQNKLKTTQERIANGVCPCCNRTFKNVQRHMTTKHPDFTPDRVDPA